MSAAIGLRDDFEADDLRRLASKAKDANQARRLLAIAAVYDGMDREEAARIGGMDRQTLRDWVHRFNEQGPDGLINIKPSGRPGKLSAEQEKDLRQRGGVQRELQPVMMGCDGGEHRGGSRRRSEARGKRAFTA